MKVRVEPDELKPDVEATLFCDAASSNPPATLSWWRDGIPVQGKTKNIKMYCHIISSAELFLYIENNILLIAINFV